MDTSERKAAYQIGGAPETRSRKLEGEQHFAEMHIRQRTLSITLDTLSSQGSLGYEPKGRLGGPILRPRGLVNPPKSHK